MKEKNEIIVIAVDCFNNEDEVINFAKQLEKQTIKNQIKLVITCNSCKNFEKLKRELELISIESFIFNPQKNLGYLHGGLYGLECLDNKVKYDWVMISNTDITFESNKFFEKFFYNMYTDDIWCIGPNIILDATKKCQNPFLVNRVSKKKMKFWKIIYSNLLSFSLYFKLSEFKHRNLKDRNIEKDSSSIYAVHGSCFFLKKDCLKEVKANIGSLFMYGEELLVAETVYENNMQIFYDKSLKVIHNENQVTSSIANRKKQNWFSQSFDYLYYRFWT